MQIDRLPVQETLEQLKIRIVEGLTAEPTVEVTEEAITNALSDLPRDTAARAESIGGALLSPIEPVGGGCRFFRRELRAPL